MLLAIETSCDETSAAIVHQGQVLSTVVSSQIRLHTEYGGVVPELATREHLCNLQPVIRSALSQAGIGVHQLEVVAATRGPGLPAALMAGFTVARSMAFALKRPLLGIHHHEAHLYSPWMDSATAGACFDQWVPNISLIVSGGHTLLVHVPREMEHVVLGSTLDDAAGECFDKVAKLLALPYPGGPVLDQLAEQGNPAAYDFPRSMLRDSSDDFSFSGLKTSVRYFLAARPGLADDPAVLRDLCASVRAAIVEVLVSKTLKAARRLGVTCITASGGVTCNRALRRDLTAACSRRSIQLRLAAPAYCTDNAAMVGILAERQWQRGAVSMALDEEPLPGWSLDRLRT